MDIDTDMDALKTISNSIDSLNILRKKSVESLLTLLFAKRAKLIKLRDEIPHTFKLKLWKQISKI